MSNVEIIKVNMMQALPMSSISFRMSVETYKNNCKREKNRKCHKSGFLLIKVSVKRSSSLCVGKWHTGEACLCRV